MIKINYKNVVIGVSFWGLLNSYLTGSADNPVIQLPNHEQLKQGFITPPNKARPGVYWYFMDGNLSKEGMTADLESMKKEGIGHVLFLEVNVGVPRGKIEFLSEEWQNLFAHGVSEAERLGIEFTLGSGPGWAGSGGPWVKPEQSMRHLVIADTIVNGHDKYDGQLPLPKPKRPYFGEGALTRDLKEIWNTYYEDVCVLAFPTPKGNAEIIDVDEKALYYRAPYTSVPNVKPYLPTSALYASVPVEAVIDPLKIIDVTDKLTANGKLNWKVPKGSWTIMRMGMRNNGAVTRPAPMPGLGFEVDKFDTTAFNAHFDAYMGKLLKKTGPKKKNAEGGWNMIHIDSWEMGAQNWTDLFRQEFVKRRGYDPLKYLPTYAGKVVENNEKSERFLWDVRQTSMELVLDNHAEHFKNLGRRYGFTLSIEPYDMNPNSDLDLGAVADVPMCEFWTDQYGYNGSFSCIEATSIAHVYGRPVVAAEAFTADHTEAWKMYPESVKNQGDWAFCMGINKFVYHTFAHKPLGDQYRPGMTMGPYGVHWDRGQTWWPMASAYHEYISRCQYVLQQGKNVADILYLTPEGAPHVFRPPLSALSGSDFLPDKRGYSFDGCSPLALIEKAEVKDHLIVFPGGGSYRILVLPYIQTMTPELMAKIKELIQNGAIVMGNPPLKSPSLVNYPACDQEVENMALKVWGSLEIPSKELSVSYGKGKIYWGGNFSKSDDQNLYPVYETTVNILKDLNIQEDFKSLNGVIRYTHRMTNDQEIYFVSNKTDTKIQEICTFRTSASSPELWNPVTGETKILSDYQEENGRISIPLEFDKYQSFFIVFDRTQKINFNLAKGLSNFSPKTELKELNGSWQVAFDPQWGGPEKVAFESLTDWSRHPNDSIKYYSGKAVYTKTFDLPVSKKDQYSDIYLSLGNVKNIARVKLNGTDLGIVWTSPWELRITDYIKKKGNQLEIEVVNLWINRLIGDEFKPDDGIVNGQWPDWLINHQTRTSGRYTFTTHRFYKKDSSLIESGLIGPVKILKQIDASTR